MKKGINKILLSIVSALLLLMPFSYSIYADQTRDLYIISAFNYFKSHGVSLTTNVSTNLYIRFPLYQYNEGTGFIEPMNPTDSYYSENEYLYTACSGKYTAASSFQEPRNIFFSKSEGEPLKLIYALNKEFDEIPGGATMYDFNLYVHPVYQRPDLNLQATATRRTIGAFFVYTYTITANYDAWFCLELNGINNRNFNRLMPIFLGYDKYMSNDTYTMLYGNINQGTQESQQAVNEADDVKDDFVNANNDFSSIEGNFSSNMNNSLNAIDTNLNLNNLSGFVYGANWVKTQFDFIINNYEPVELLVTYSLILGLAMLLIGKRLL